jgi:hypothetical protein
MHLREVDALAAGQDARWAAAAWSSGAPPGSNVEGQLPGASANSQSRPTAAVLPVLKAAVRRRYRGCLAFGTIPADSNPAQTATDPETCLHKQKTGDHAQHQIDDGARLLGRVGQHLVGRPDK